jgi:hypothetical protein
VQLHSDLHRNAPLPPFNQFFERTGVNMQINKLSMVTGIVFYIGAVITASSAQDNGRRAPEKQGFVRTRLHTRPLGSIR